MTSAFNDQKLLSARLNSRLPNSQPRAATPRKSAMGTMPMRAGVIFPASFPAHAEATSGISPTTTAGTMNKMSQATTSLARLISPSRLPAMVKSELDLVLDASSSMSPCRGSTNGFMRPILELVGVVSVARSLACAVRQTCSRSTSRSYEDLWPMSCSCASRKASAQRRPSSRSRHRNSHSALSLEE